MLDNSTQNYFGTTNGAGKIACFMPNDNNENIVKYISTYMDQIDRVLLKFGGILLRGFSIHSISEFNTLANTVIPNLLEYVNRSTPRTKLGGKIYTATEYPADKRIPFHNENSYTLSWPSKIIFFSAIVADEGGETAIADSRNVYKNIPKEIIAEFDAKKVMYIRNFTPGIDLSWQTVFQTENKNDVEMYCQQNNISYEWKSGVELTVKQTCQATIRHPETEENSWFNQAHLFHRSALSYVELDGLINLLGEDNLPRNAYFGDGTEIPENYLQLITAAYEKEQIEFKWQTGDVMLLDNRIMAHSRNPFKGERKVVVAMGN